VKSKLLLLLAAAVAVASILILFRESWSLEPFKNESMYENISRVATDSDGATYTITDSKKVVRKVDESGELIYSIPSTRNLQPDTIQLFSSITTDDKGNAYVLITILDSYGLKVLGERIVRISPDGRATTRIYDAEYQLSDNLLRVGKIQSLSTKDGYVYFFKKDSSSASLLRLQGASPAELAQTPEVIRTVEMSNNRYLNELAGHEAERFFFSSKRGFLYAVTDGTASQIYPQSDEELLNFPVGIVTDDRDYVYYIDYHESAIQRLNMNKPDQPVETFLAMDKLAGLFADQEWSDFTSISAANGTITVATSDQLVQLSSNGAIESIQSSFHYPKSDIWLKLGYWILILALVVIVITLIRFVYIHVLRRKLFLLLKQLAMIIPVVLLLMVGLSYSVYSSFSREIKEDTNNQLLLLAGNGKYLVDGKNLENIDSPRDFMSEDYQAIKLRLNELFSSTGDNRDGLYNTIYRYLDDQLYIIMDDDDSVTMFQPFALSEENLLVLKEGKVISGEWEDSTGQWMYAIGPLYNSSGDIIGIYESGKDMIGMNKSTSKIVADILKIIALIGVVLLLVITFMTMYLVSSIHKLRRSVNLIAGGEWDVKVQIRTRDEVEELGERFNMMASSIRQYIQEVTKLSNSYFRFVPQQFLKVLGKTNMTQISLGEQTNRRMTILVCNMRDFSEFSNKLTTEENFKFINSYLKVFGPIIRDYGGFTSRYLGPGMLSMFPNDPGEALKAAIKLRSILESYNVNRQNTGYEPIEIGIAVHTADVMIGIIGEEQRMEGSVVSTHVELTLDLEKLSTKLGVNVLLTDDALRSMRKHPQGHYRRLGAFQLEGEPRTIELYDLYEGDTEHIRRLKHETRQQFEHAVELFQSGRFYDAREGFVAVVKKNRYDLAAKLYFFECDRFFQEGVSEQWNNALRIS
jgi:adenylate cyclase